MSDETAFFSPTKCNAKKVTNKQARILRVCGASEGLTASSCCVVFRCGQKWNWFLTSLMPAVSFGASFCGGHGGKLLNHPKCLEYVCFVKVQGFATNLLFISREIE